MSYKGKTSSKRGGGKSSNPFERMMQEQCNKPVAAKSAGIVGKWGATSFTSLRTTGDNQAAAPRPKKFFKSRGDNSENKESLVTVTSAKIVEPAPRPSQTATKPIKHKIKEKSREHSGSSRGAWSPRPPLERSPLHPSPHHQSPSPLHPSPRHHSPSPLQPPPSPLKPSPPTYQPSTTPPRDRVPLRKTRQRNEEEPQTKIKAEDPIKVEKSSDFDSLFSSSLPSDRKSKVKAEIDENRRSGSENRQGETENRRDGGRRKRKHEGEGGSAPRIKLKISLNKSPDKPDNTYKVIRSKDDDLLSVCSQSSNGSEHPSEVGSDKTDMSNGFQKPEHRLINPYYKPESVKPFSAGKPPPEASKLPPEDSSAPTSPPAARKYGRRHKAPVKPVPESADYPKPSETSADLMPKPTEPEPTSDLPNRKLAMPRRGNLPTEPTPSSDLPKRKSTVKPAISKKKESESISPEPDLPKRKPAKKSAAASRTPSPDPEIDFPKRKPAVVKKPRLPEVEPTLDFPMNFPKRKAPVNKTEPKPSSYKRTIFKSRSKTTSSETSQKIEKVESPMEPPRVPPIVDPFVDVNNDRANEEISQIVDEKPTKVRIKRVGRSAKESTDSDNILKESSPFQTKPVDTQPIKTIKILKTEDKTADVESKQTEPKLLEPTDVQTKNSEPKHSEVRVKLLEPKPSDARKKPLEPNPSDARNKPLEPKPSKVKTKPSDYKLKPMSVKLKSLNDVKSSEESTISSSQETLDPPSPPSFADAELDFNFPARLPQRKQIAKPPVKAKKTFFKSKSSKEPGKALSLYKHNVGWDGDKKDEKKDQEKKVESSSMDFELDEDEEMDSHTEPITAVGDISFAPSKLTRVATYPTIDTNIDDEGELVTQVKCPKSYKSFFTVIKKVKRAHEINDYGENQEFHDDVDYIVDGLNVRHAMSLRCLTAISLASKCMKPNFRMHLRAHSVVTRFFAELQDAPENPSLALCTSTVLFVLSQDRLNMDMDRDSLKLMLNLLDTDCKIGSALEGVMDNKELEKNKQKVIDICDEMQKKGHAGSLNLDLISADHLSMETLLSMTSKRAGEWFKEELRELGGLGHLARTFSDCVTYLTIKTITSWTDILTDKLKKTDRILRVLENVSNENEENVNFLLSYTIDNQDFVRILQNLFQLLDTEVQLNPTTDFSDKESVGVIIRETLFSTIRVHVNIVHDYKKDHAHGSLIIGQQQGMIGRALRCLFIIPFWFVPLSKRFESLILALALLINLVENCVENRQSLMDSMAAQKELGLCVKEEPRLAIEDLVQMYLDREELAKISESKTDNILDNVEEEVQEIDPKEEEKKADKGRDTLEETVQKLINKAGSNMESSVIAAYIGLVIGYLTQNSDDYECRIREYLPTRDFKSMVEVLKKLNNFMEMTSNGSSHSNKNLKGTQKIITYLEKLDAEPIEEEEEEESALDFSFETTRDETILQDGPDFSTSFGGLDDFGKF